MATSSIFSKKSCVIVTGASRGLGECIAKRFAKEFPETSVFILLARTRSALESVKQQICSKPQCPTVLVADFDQGQFDKSHSQNILNSILNENGVNPCDFEQAVIVHNCGTPGDPTKFAQELSDPDVLQSSFNVNVTGMILLNTDFFNIFTDKSKRRVVINMSSLAAVKPLPCMSLYCSGKAARDMFFQVLALEEPSIRVLNYGPGACETDMLREIRETAVDPEVRKRLQGFHDQGQTLDCDTSISKLIDILHLNTFESGAHVDYHDKLVDHAVS